MSRRAAHADVFAAVADPTRRRILELLAAGEKAVKELAAAFQISQPSVSEHLRVLRDVGLVQARQDGRLRLYRLDAARMKEIADWAAAFSRFWDKRLDSLGEYLDRSE